MPPVSQHVPASPRACYALLPPTESALGRSSPATYTYAPYALDEEVQRHTTDGPDAYTIIHTVQPTQGDGFSQGGVPLGYDKLVQALLPRQPWFCP